jgi:pyruvate/2-oxoglutarate dehydrogenase complex dihydrolipoamide acyltransferase (E2) component
VRHADEMTAGGLARAIHRQVEKARLGKLTPDDFAGGTYTISNNGAFGTLFTAPIVNPPQVAILSTDAVRKRPVVLEGTGGDSIAIRPVGIVAQSFDHRAFDGAYSAAFLQRVKQVLETREWERELS